MRFSSSITFLYYKDVEYGKNFMTKVLELEPVMDQKEAFVFRVNKTSFLGVVHSANPKPGDTLISLNTDSLEKEYERIQKLPTFDISDITSFDHIPLKSFFFKDYEGHRFEIQQFQNKEDEMLFK